MASNRSGGSPARARQPVHSDFSGGDDGSLGSVAATSGVGSEAANAAYQRITDLCFASPVPEIINGAAPHDIALVQVRVILAFITDALLTELRHLTDKPYGRTIGERTLLLCATFLVIMDMFSR